MTTDTAALAINSARINPLANVSEIMLADEFGDVETRIDALKARQKLLRKEMTRRGLFSIIGDRFVVVKTIEDSLRFDGEGVKREMGADWYEERRKPSESTTYTVIPKKPASTRAGDVPSPERAAAEALFRRPA